MPISCVERWDDVVPSRWGHPHPLVEGGVHVRREQRLADDGHRPALVADFDGVPDRHVQISEGGRPEGHLGVTLRGPSVGQDQGDVGRGLSFAGTAGEAGDPDAVDVDRQPVDHGRFVDLVHCGDRGHEIRVDVGRQEVGGVGPGHGVPRHAGPFGVLDGVVEPGVYGHGPDHAEDPDHGPHQGLTDGDLGPSPSRAQGHGGAQADRQRRETAHPGQRPSRPFRPDPGSVGPGGEHGRAAEDRGHHQQHHRHQDRPGRAHSPIRVDRAGGAGGESNRGQHPDDQGRRRGDSCGREVGDDGHPDRIRSGHPEGPGDGEVVDRGGHRLADGLADEDQPRHSDRGGQQQEGRPLHRGGGLDPAGRFLEVEDRGSRGEDLVHRPLERLEVVGAVHEPHIGVLDQQHLVAVGCHHPRRHQHLAAREQELVDRPHPAHDT